MSYIEISSHLDILFCARALRESIFKLANLTNAKLLPVMKRIFAGFAVTFKSINFFLSLSRRLNAMAGLLSLH